jgi:hypothetical protein
VEPHANVSWTVQVHRAWNVPPPPTCTQAVNVSSATKARAIGRGLWTLVVRVHALAGMPDPTVSTRMPSHAQERGPSSTRVPACTASMGMPDPTVSTRMPSHAQERGPSSTRVPACTASMGTPDPTVSTRMPLRATEKAPSKIQAHASTALKGMLAHNASSPTDTRAQEKAPSMIQACAPTAPMGTPAHNVNSQTGTRAMETAKHSLLACAIVTLGFTLTPTATRALQTLHSARISPIGCCIIQGESTMSMIVTTHIKMISCAVTATKMESKPPMHVVHAAMTMGAAAQPAHCPIWPPATLPAIRLLAVQTLTVKMRMGPATAMWAGWVSDVNAMLD